MKYLVILVFSVIVSGSFAQVKGLKLNNLVVVAQFDKIEDRFSIESAMTGLLTQQKVKTTPSVNYVKAGESATVLAGDSLMNLLKEKGFDTYVIVSVRGYDRSYKPSALKYTFLEKLDQGTLREIFRSAAVSVTFEFAFYRNGEFVGIDQIKCTNISDRDSVMKKFVKLTEKKIIKWRLS